MISNGPQLVELAIIKERCSQFIEESGGIPIIKHMIGDYGDFHKIKVRWRKLANENEIVKTSFDLAFNSTFHNIRARSIFAKSATTSIGCDDTSAFYVFPIDGYRYLYSLSVKDSQSTYEDVIDKLSIGLNANDTKSTLTDIIQFSYRSSNLIDGLKSGSELLIFNIPYFYIIRTSYASYDTILSEIMNSQLDIEL